MMKKVFYILSTIAILLCGCSTKVIQTKSTDMVDTKNVQTVNVKLENVQEEDPELSDNNEKNSTTPEADIVRVLELEIGGSAKSEYLYPYYIYFGGIGGDLYNIIGAEKCDEWLSQFESPTNPEGRNVLEKNDFYFVQDFGITKDVFIEATAGMYTQEQVDAIYSGDIKQVNEKLKNDLALFVDGRIFTADWLASHTFKEYKKEGITEEIVLDYLEKIKSNKVLRDEQRLIYGVIYKQNKDKEKIQKYTNAEYLDVAPYINEFYGIPDFVNDIVDENALTDWTHYFVQSECYGKDNGKNRPITECTIVNLVKEFSIDKAEFIEANNGQFFTDQQIDAIYSDDLRVFNDVFAGENTIVVEGSIYTVEWLINNKVDDYKKAGITVQSLEALIDKLNSNNLKGTEEYEELSATLNDIKENNLLP